ncbi:hypothetical protein EMPS_08822 [Entomortierella parvispora]|uniref:Uncharacterized protein n=1 Tax=Entomortierella parvispora TaxID=205924 RepID=A0A9P3LZQ8_9FUNG|nr:hypothetical protein EMPS_08822 [Entomortierella parvispora]
MAASSTARTLSLQGSPSVSLANHPHRSSLKATNNQVRWPVNLNQLAAISLDDDSDLDRSLTDVSRDDIGSVKLLRMLKDSDDESSSALSSDSRLRRPRSTYSNMQQTQQKQKLGNPAARSSLQMISDPQLSSTSIPKPQRSRSDNRGPTDASAISRLSRHSSLRQHQSEVALTTAKRQSYAGNSPEDMESIYSEAQALAQRLSAQSARVNGTTAVPEGMARPAVKREALTQSGIPSNRTSVSGGDVGSMLRKPRASLTQASRLSVPSKLTTSNSTPTLKTRTGITAIPGSKPESRTNGPALKPREQEREVPSPSRIPGSPTSSLPTPAARKLAGLQQQSPLSRSSSKSNSSESQMAPALLPNLPISPVSTNESQTIAELTEELEMWKTEAREHQREKAATEGLRKQITILERDLETALETLQNTEGKLIQTKAEQDSLQPKLSEYEKTMQEMKSEMERERSQREQLKAEEVAVRQQEQEDLRAVSEAKVAELERQLTKAHQEIEQLEIQASPPELQDIQQALFSATQDLEESKLVAKKLEADLAEEKIKVSREQEDSGHLLVKLSQLQETIANQLRDNNDLKDQVKEHDKCIENAEMVEYKHKQELSKLQNDINAQQKSLLQEQEQRAMIEQAFQEQQFQSHQLQQQIQLQQTQLLQQQTEIVNLRAALEVEQKQSALLQEQRLNNPQFGRRVSLDGELNGSFLMIETTNSFGSQSGPPTCSDAGMKLPGQSPIHASYQPTTLLSSPGTGTGGFVPTGSSAGLSSIHQQGSVGTGVMNRPIQSNTGFANQGGLTGAAAGLPPTGATVIGGMASSSGSAPILAPMEVEVKPRMIHRGSSGSISGILANSGPAANNRLSMHGDPMGSSGGVTQSVEELTAQLQTLIKEKEKLQAELSKIPISGGGPMSRRKMEMLEEQMDETERAISKIRYNIRMKS